MSSEAKEKYIHMLKILVDVFAWSYEDLKVYDKNIIQHTIPVKEEKKPSSRSSGESTLYYCPLSRKKLKSCLMPRLLCL